MSRVEDLVATELSRHPVERISVAIVIPSSMAQPISRSSDCVTRSGPSAIACVETRFLKGIPDFNAQQLARVNRRSAFGSLFKA
jgi:hypothetical protein